MAPCCTDRHRVVVRSSGAPIGDEPAGRRALSGSASPTPRPSQAVEALGLQSIRPSRSTLHLLDYRPGSAPSSLASAGVTISVHDSGDLSLLTVQVRHVRRRRLHPDGRPSTAGTMRCCASRRNATAPGGYWPPVSPCRYEHAGPALAGADLRLTDLLTPRQWSFLQDCAPGQPQPGPLRPVRPDPGSLLDRQAGSGRCHREPVAAPRHGRRD